MPTSADSPLLLDTSAAVALCVADHEQHRLVSSTLRGKSLGLSGHAAFETFSVLTRMPGEARRSPAIVSELLARNFPRTRFLSAAGSKALLATIGRSGVAGGSVYDALVAAAAKEHRATLVTLDHRALGTYRAVGATVALLNDD